MSDGERAEFVDGVLGEMFWKLVSDLKQKAQVLKKEDDSKTADVLLLLAQNAEMKAFEIGASPGVMRALKSGWPWGSHDTRHLQALAGAADRFWKNYDPADSTTAPKSDDVSAWLQSEKQMSQRVAEVIAQILRADGLATGPRK